MAKTTMGERLAKLETKVEYIAKGMDTITQMLEERVQREDERFSNLDKKYASKLVEKIVYSMVGIILTTTIFALIKLVL